MEQELMLAELTLAETAR